MKYLVANDSRIIDYVPRTESPWPLFRFAFLSFLGMTILAGLVTLLAILIN